MCLVDLLKFQLVVTKVNKVVRSKLVKLKFKTKEI